MLTIEQKKASLSKLQKDGIIPTTMPKEGDFKRMSKDKLDLMYEYGQKSYRKSVRKFCYAYCKAIYLQTWDECERLLAIVTGKNTKYLKT